MNPLHDELTRLLNSHSAENKSNTPDYILATYMLASLKAFEEATVERDRWYGIDHEIAAVVDNEVPIRVVNTPPTDADLGYYPDRTTQ